MIRIIVAGASGRMGQEVVKMIAKNTHLTMVAGVSRSKAGKDIGETLGVPLRNMFFTETVMEAISLYKADVLVDFTTPLSVKENVALALKAGIRPIIGTSGLSEKDLEDIKVECKKKGIGAIVAPNFAIGAVLMMVFAAKAAKYLPHLEIIESHHDKKLDAPSGTAWKTASLIAENRPQINQGHPQEMELLEGARGANWQGFRIHSIRLPGLLAHQEVLMGGEGEILSIRHDSLHRESFMSGVKLAIERVLDLNELVYGLENILEI